MDKTIAAAQAQLQILQAQVGLKEYSANWLKDAKTVVRDGSGKFASQNLALFKPESLSVEQRSQLLGNVPPEQLVQVEQVLETLGLSSDQVFRAIQREEKFTQRQRERLINQDPTLPDRTNTLLKRVLELPELAAAQQETPSKALELQWHQAIIQSEVRYGDLIDRVIEKDPWDNVPYAVTTKLVGAHGFGSSYNPVNIGDEENSPNPARKAHKQLMRRLTKSKSRIKASVITADVINKAKELAGEIAKNTVFLMGSGVTEKDKVVIKKRIDEAMKASKDFGKLINTDIPHAYIGLFGLGLTIKEKFLQLNSLDIAYVLSGFSPEHTLINVGLIGIPRVLMFHELGHAVEKVTKLTPMTWNYIDSRKKEGIDFPYAYTTKKYGLNPEKGGSELISTATQMLASSRDLHRAAVLDREHLMIGLYALDKEV